jgi:hypothetical protein
LVRPGRERPEAHGLIRPRLIEPAFEFYLLQKLGLRRTMEVGAVAGLCGALRAGLPVD